MKLYYITFRSVTFAQRGEQMLEGGGVHCALLRTPKWMEARGCGYSLRFRTGDIDAVAARLREGRIPMGKIYVQTPDGGLEEI